MEYTLLFLNDTFKMKNKQTDFYLLKTWDCVYSSGHNLCILGGSKVYPLPMFLARLYMSLVMRKPAFCLCENKDADQLRGNREADQRLCFRYTDSTIPLLSKSEISRPVFSQRGSYICTVTVVLIAPVPGDCLPFTF